MRMPESVAEVEATISGAISDLLGTVYRKIGRTTVATGSALFVQWPSESVTDATVSGLACYVSLQPSYGVIDLHDQAAIAGEWRAYLVQYRGSNHIDEATRRLLRAFPLSRAVPVQVADDDGNSLTQVALTIKGATT